MKILIISKWVFIESINKVNKTIKQANILLRKAKPRNQTCFTSSDGNVMGLDFRTQTFLKIDDALVETRRWRHRWRNCYNLQTMPMMLIKIHRSGIPRGMERGGVRGCGPKFQSVKPKPKSKQNTKQKRQKTRTMCDTQWKQKNKPFWMMIRRRISAEAWNDIIVISWSQYIC